MKVGPATRSMKHRDVILVHYDIGGLPSLFTSFNIT